MVTEPEACAQYTILAAEGALGSLREVCIVMDVYDSIVLTVEMANASSWWMLVAA